MYLTQEWKHIPRSKTEDVLEDGTLPFLEILSIKHCLQSLKRFPNGISTISEHTFQLAQYLYHSLTKLKYNNGSPVVELYSSNDFDDIEKQGGIVTFNLLKKDGNHFGFTVFREVAKKENVMVRTGCFCNVGACQKYLKYQVFRRKL